MVVGLYLSFRYNKGVNMFPSWSELAGFLSFYGFTPQTVTPLVVISFFLYLLLSKHIDHVKERTAYIERCIVEIQGILTNKYELRFQQSIAAKYGQANSPIVLKNQFRKYITEPDLDKQIEQKKSELVAWLKNEKPQTGLDAQDYITHFVGSNEVNDYLDLTQYKQNLYQKGKTSEDAIGILAVYLFEVLIPELNLTEGE